MNAKPATSPTPRYRFRRRRWQWLCAAIDAVGSRLMSWRPQPKHTPPGPPRSILLIQLDHLGDAVLSLGLIARMRRLFPNARLEVLCSPWTQPLFESLPEVSRVHVSHHNRFRRPASHARWLLDLAVWAIRLRRVHFDCAIDVRGELPHALLMRWAGIHVRIGHTAGGGEFLLTESISYDPSRHQIADRAELLSALCRTYGLTDTPRIESCHPRYAPPTDVTARIQRRRMHIGANDRIIVLHLGAGTPAKRWPAEHWRTLAQRLLRTTDAHLILVGTSDDCPVAQQLLSASDLRRVHDWTGTLSLSELAALLAGADLFIGADSGPAHLAAAVGAPCVVLFSGTNDPAVWRPVGPASYAISHPVSCTPCARTTCPLPGHPCLTDLSPARVHAVIHRLLADRALPPPHAIGTPQRQPDQVTLAGTAP